MNVESQTTILPVSTENTQPRHDTDYAFKATAYLASITGISAMIGFGATLSMAKRKDPTYFDRGVIVGPSLAESGTSLALRALGWGTVYAVGGCSILFLTMWKLSGCNNLHEFRLKMGEKLPKIQKNNPPQSRTEFEGLTDLMTYLETWNEKPETTRIKENSEVAPVKTNNSFLSRLFKRTSQ